MEMNEELLFSVNLHDLVEEAMKRTIVDCANFRPETRSYLVRQSAAMALANLLTDMEVNK